LRVYADSSAFSIMSYVLTRLRSPYTSSMREVVGQNLASFTHSVGNAATSRLYGWSHYTQGPVDQARHVRC